MKYDLDSNLAIPSQADDWSTLIGMTDTSPTAARLLVKDARLYGI